MRIKPCKKHGTRPKWKTDEINMSAQDRLRLNIKPKRWLECYECIVERDERLEEEDPENQEAIKRWNEEQ